MSKGNPTDIVIKVTVGKVVYITIFLVISILVLYCTVTWNVNSNFKTEADRITENVKKESERLISEYKDTLNKKDTALENSTKVIAEFNEIKSSVSEIKEKLGIAMIQNDIINKNRPIMNKKIESKKLDSAISSLD